jgi:hypothetical protein
MFHPPSFVFIFSVQQTSTSGDPTLKRQKENSSEDFNYYVLPTQSLTWRRAYFVTLPAFVRFD